MKKQFAIASVFTFAAALFGITACATNDTGPDKRDDNQVGSGETCGGCNPEDESVNDDGTINICAPCDGEGITEPWADTDTGGGSGSGDAGTGPVSSADGNTTQLQCREARDRDYGECDREKGVGDRACDAAYAGNMSSCMSGVYQRCGTMSSGHHCVIAGRQECVRTTAATLQDCNRDVNDNHGRCRGAVDISFKDCMLHANNRPSAFLRMWRNISPF